MLIAAEIADAAAAGQRNLWINDAHDFAAFDGFPIGAHLLRPPEQWAHEIGFAIGNDRDGFFRKTAGAFGVVSGRVGGDVTAFADFTGGAPLFYAQQPGLVAISNRAGLIGRTVLDGTPDIDGLSLLSGQANMFVPFSSYRGVRSLRPGWGVSVNADHDLKLFPLPRFWSPPAERRQLTDRDFDSLTERLAAPMSYLKQVPFHEFTLSLTGGRDSRLCLALAQTAGLDPVCWTGGLSMSPEIECARSVAAVAGVAYRAETFEAKAFDFDAYWERLKINTHRYDGMLCLFDGNVGPSRAPRSKAEIKGLGGEIFSIHIKAHRTLSPTSVAEAIRRLRDYQQPADPLGVQQRMATRCQRDFLESAITLKAEEGVALEDLTDLLYLENRMPLWSALLGARLGNLALQPLCNFEAARIAYSTEARHRRIWRFHYEAMHRLSPRLAEHPFLGTPWDQELAPFIAGPIAPPFKSTIEVSFSALAASQVLALQAGWKTIAELLLDHPSSGLFDIVDRQQLIEVLRAGPDSLDGYGVKQMHSLIGMQMFLSGMGQRQFDGYTGRPPALDTNVKGLRLRHEEQAWWLQKRKHSGLAASPATGVPSDLFDRSASIRRTFTFSGGAARRLRIDPLNGPGRAVIGKVTIRKGRRGVTVPPEQWHLSNARIIARSDAFTLIESDHDDPQLHFDLAALGAGKAPLRVEAEIASDLPAFTTECFLDRGAGYTRDGMRRLVISDPRDQTEGDRLIRQLFPDRAAIDPPGRDMPDDGSLTLFHGGRLPAPPNP